MGVEVKLGCGLESGAITYPASVKAQWTTVHGNLSDTAETATVLLRPATYASAFVYPARIHHSATRISIMARYKQATSMVTTTPVVRIYGIWGADTVVNASTGAIADDGTAIIRRLDNGASNGAGITLTLTTAAAADKMRDTTYRYSDEYDITGVDLRGAKWLLALTETAASISGGADTVVELLAMATN